MAGISLAAMTAASYIAFERDDSKEVRARLDGHAHRLAVVETRLELLLSERLEDRRERRRPDE